QVHFVHESPGRSQVLLSRFDQHRGSTTTAFQQAPIFWHFAGRDQARRREIETLATHTFFGVPAEGLVAVREEVCPRDLALDQNRAAGALPPDRVRHLAANAGLFGEYDAAAVRSQPL